MTSARVRVAIGVIALSMVTASCSSGGGSSKTLPPRPAEFYVEMADYRFDHLPAAPSGRVVFRVRNEGGVEHSLTVLVLPEDYPPLDEQLRGDVRRSVGILASIPDPRPPGSTDSFAVDLVPGRYGLICNLRDADGVVHGLKGMNSEFRVRPLSEKAGPSVAGSRAQSRGPA